MGQGRKRPALRHGRQPGWITSRPTAKPPSTAPRPTSWPAMCWAANGSSPPSRSISSSPPAWAAPTSAKTAQEHTPVVLHRAVTGTTERFLGVLIEHFAGAFPVWLAPVQAMLIPIADRHLDYAHEVAEQAASSRACAWKWTSAASA